MNFEEVGLKIRATRLANKLTQTELAQAVGLSRTTINQIESGACPDLGIRKLIILLTELRLELSLKELPANAKNRDFLEMACISASVSYRTPLEKQELLRALISGDVPIEKRAHLRVVFDELPASIFNGMVHQVGAWCPEKKLRKNLAEIARKLHSVRSIAV